MFEFTFTEILANSEIIFCLKSWFVSREIISLSKFLVDAPSFIIMPSFCIKWFFCILLLLKRLHLESNFNRNNPTTTNTFRRLQLIPSQWMLFQQWTSWRCQGSSKPCLFTLYSYLLNHSRQRRLLCKKRWTQTLSVSPCSILGYQFVQNMKEDKEVEFWLDRKLSRKVFGLMDKTALAGLHKISLIDVIHIDKSNLLLFATPTYRWTQHLCDQNTWGTDMLVLQLRSIYFQDNSLPAFHSASEVCD